MCRVQSKQAFKDRFVWKIGGPAVGGADRRVKSGFALNAAPRSEKTENGNARLRCAPARRGRRKRARRRTDGSPSAGGNEVRFVQRLKTKLESKPEYVARKELLEWGCEAVCTGFHTRQHVEGKTRDYYAKIIESNGKGMLVIVDAKDGEAFHLFASDERYLKRKGYLPNSRLIREWAWPGEQPPDGVLQAIAAAGGLTDYCEFTPSHHTFIPPLSPRVGNAGTAPELAERKQEKDHMNEKLIQALGLPPEATEDDVLQDVGDMKKRLDELEAEKAEALVENDLKALGDREGTL